MSDYAEWDAASVDLASEIVKEHGRKIEGAALVNLRQTDEGRPFELVINLKTELDALEVHNVKRHI